MTLSRLDLSRVRAVTLDLDDTLWPVWPTIERAETTLRAWLTDRAPATARLAADSHHQRRAREAVLQAQPEIAHDLGRLRREAIRHLLRLAQEDVTLAEPAYEVFYAARQRVDLFPDALATLQLLSARFPVVALTNGNADVHHIGIGGYFHDALNPAKVGVSKPDVRFFQAGAAAAGVAPEAVLHIGDDAQLDGAGALAAGMQTVWVNRTDERWPPELPDLPHAEVPSLTALNALLG
ncbi:HAD-IA family hydrolase [Ottowia sp. GY511]|uniref:HAD-IA family hydrolase n=1 Tax=Ottowia flava TaxID=2675430 RepID=A0ABW4KS86_9BURK|nr:HAD-IA family hydrolase [Ottowia sp. GY511]TXK24700.1 HAD-IA family hydrolase [Ottowia sp. GY511]